MSQPTTLDKVVLAQMMSRKPKQIAKAINQAQSFGWDHAQGPKWKQVEKTQSWQEASHELADDRGSFQENYLDFDGYFEESSHLGVALKEQTAEAGTFLIGKQVEFEGNHNDAEFTGQVMPQVQGNRHRPY